MLVNPLNAILYLRYYTCRSKALQIVSQHGRCRETAVSFDEKIKQIFQAFLEEGFRFSIVASQRNAG